MNNSYRYQFFVLFLILIIGVLIGCAGTPKFSSSDSALMVIDIQNGYLPVSNQGVFIPNVSKLIDRARDSGVPVVFIRNLNSYDKEGSHGWKFHGAVRPAEGEIVVNKLYPSSFSDTELKSVLDEMGISNLVLTGLASSGCYGATVRDAHRLGYNTVVVTDAHADQVKGRADNLNDVLVKYETIMLIETEDIVFTSR